MGEIKLFVTNPGQVCRRCNDRRGVTPLIASLIRRRGGGTPMAGRVVKIGLAALAWAGSTTAAIADGSAPNARFDWFEYAGSDLADSVTTVGPNDYRNPILQGFYPAPSLTRAGDVYYLVNSTFAWFPGLSAFRSRDLA